MLYLGSGAYGVADAAWIYFSKAPDQLHLRKQPDRPGLPAGPVGVYSPLVTKTWPLQRPSTSCWAVDAGQAGFISVFRADEGRGHTAPGFQPAFAQVLEQ